MANPILCATAEMGGSTNADEESWSEVGWLGGGSIVDCRRDDKGGLLVGGAGHPKVLRWWAR